MDSCQVNNFMKMKKCKAKDLAKTGIYVLFGFCKSSIDEVGYLTAIPKTDDDSVIADDLEDAMRFNDSNVDSALKYVNEEFDALYGPHAYSFHKVKVIK